MINQIRSEWVKIRSVRSTLSMMAAAVGLAIGVAALVIIVANPTETPTLGIGDALLGVQMATMLFCVLGVQVIGQEYRFNTIRPTFSTVASRSRVIVAKLVTLLGVVTAVAAALVGLAIAAAALIGSAQGFEFDLSAPSTWHLIVGNIAICVLSAAFGFAIGAIVRQPIAGVMIALIWSLVAENLLGGLVPKTAKWLPLSSAQNLVSADSSTNLMGPVAGGLYCAAIMAGLVAFGSWRIATTDA